jgi:long-chain acyl-CoA synthetase
LLREEIERVSAVLRPHERLLNFLVTTEALPRTPLGKLKRHQLPNIYDRLRTGKPAPQTHELSADDQALLARPEIGPVWNWLSARFPDRPLSPDASPQLDLGVDSLQWIELTLELQDHFNIKLTEDAIGRILSVRDLLNEVTLQRTHSGGAPKREVDLAQWLAPVGFGYVLFGLLLYGLGFSLARLMFGLQINEKGLVPSGRSIVLTPNHSSYLDPVVLAASFSWAELRNTYWVGWSQIMLRGPIMRAVSRAFRVLPIDPDRDPGETLALVHTVLRRQQRLVWFPEGHLSATGEITHFLPGIALVLEQTGASAVPVHISGTFQAMPRSHFLPRPHKVVVTFGQPINVDDLAAAGQGPNRHARIADALQRAVSNLDPRYRPEPNRVSDETSGDKGVSS